ncbi:WG repeat-containing protein [Flagellimonas sp. S174]|uniref:WG repeat-containing protein n=1 Tax=Flagellimonas sp. S174 TaxID=3410790 RepID=UPI003BF5AED5
MKYSLRLSTSKNLPFLMVLGLVLLIKPSNALAQTESFMVPYRSGSKWGYADLDARLVIPAVYDSVGIPRQKNESSLEVFYRKNGTMKAGIIDYSGNTIVEPEYDVIKYNSYGVLTYGTVNYMIDDNRKVVDSLQSLLNAKGEVLISEGPFSIERNSRLNMYLLNYNDRNSGTKVVVFNSGESGIIQELTLPGKGTTYVNDYDEIVQEKEDGEILYYKKTVSGEFVFQRNNLKEKPQVIEEIRPIEANDNEKIVHDIVVSFDGSYANIAVIPENRPDLNYIIESIPLSMELTKKVLLNPVINDRYAQFNAGGNNTWHAVRYKEWYYGYLEQQKKYIMLFPWKKQIFEIEADKISENIIYNSVGIFVKIRRESKWHVFLTGKGIVNKDGFDEVMFMESDDQIGGTNNLYHSVFIFKINGKYNLMNKNGKIMLSKGYDKIEFLDGCFRLIDGNKVDFFTKWKEIPAKLSLDHFSINELELIYGEQKGYRHFGKVFKKEKGSQSETFCGFVSLEGMKFFED